MSNEIIKILREIGKRELVSLVETDCPPTIDLLDFTRMEIIQVFLNLYGSDPLGNQQLRYILLNGLSTIELQQLCESINKPFDHSKSLVTLALANLPWSTTNKLIPFFQERFSLSEKYFPQTDRKADPVSWITRHEAVPELFDFQAEVIAKSLQILDREQRILIQLPTGTGKTRTCMELLIALWDQDTHKDKKVLWLAHSSEILEQAHSTLTKVWQVKGSGTLKAVRLYGAYSASPSNYSPQFFFCTYQKIASGSRLRSSWFESIQRDDLIIVCDEAHKSAAEKYRESIEKLLSNRALLIGLTATPGRSILDQEENAKLSRLYRGNKVEPSLGRDPIRELQDRKILAKVQFEEFETNFKIKDYRNQDDEGDFSKQVLVSVEKSTPRNDLICEIISREVKKSKRLLVFACSVEHAKFLCALLGARGINARYLDHSFSTRERQNIVVEFNEGSINVLLNYEILSTGFDSPNLDAVLIARPTASPILFSQIIGRVLRGPRVGGTEVGYIYDLVDVSERHESISHVHNLFSHYWGDGD